MISSIFYDTTDQESLISIAQHIAQLLGGEVRSKAAYRT